MGVSLDGFIAGPDGAIDWTAPDEELHRFHNEQTKELGAHFCGRRLYQEMVYWETADQNPSASDYEVEFARIWQGLPKIVFSTTLTAVEGNAALATGGVAEEVAKLKQQPGKDLAVGGAGLAATPSPSMMQLAPRDAPTARGLTASRVGRRAAALGAAAGAGVAQPADPARRLGLARELPTDEPLEHARGEALHVASLGGGEAGERILEHGGAGGGHAPRGTAPGRGQPQARRPPVGAFAPADLAGRDQAVDKADGA
jgi:dihydrofolate reductase